jgi:hypothetical protein
LKEEKFFGEHFLLLFRAKVKKKIHKLMTNMPRRNAIAREPDTFVCLECVPSSRMSRPTEMLRLFSYPELGPKNKKKNFYFYCEENRRTFILLLHRDAVSIAGDLIYGCRNRMWVEGT